LEANVFSLSPRKPTGHAAGSAGELPSVRQPAARVERVLAVGRAFLTVTGLLAIYLDPTEPARLREVTYGVLLSYALYSVAVLAYVHGPARLTIRHAYVLHALDVLWTSALTFVSDGPVSPFFLFFLFVVVAAAYRWGFVETAGTAVITIGIFLIETAVAATGPWSSSWLSLIDFELNGTILRVAYLLLTGVLMGYLAEQDKHSRQELSAMAAAGRQHHANLGLGGAVIAVGRSMLRDFGATAAAIVVHDRDTQRTLLWHLNRGLEDVRRVRVRRLELDAQKHAAWLFPDCGGTWHVSGFMGDEAVVRKTEPLTWSLARATVRLPQEVRAHPFKTVTVVNLGLPGEWQARVYLFDIRNRGNLERRLHFLEALAEQVTPALTNVFLQRRLRARAGASERARVARELHDGAIQTLIAIEMKIEAMRREAGRGSSDVFAELAEIQRLLREEILALRELMQALRPIELDSGEQLPDVLAALVERFRRDSGISARFISSVETIMLPPVKALEIVRIVQEALVNARKHSRARNVLVRFTEQNGAHRVVIEDDGCGFDFEGRLSGSELERRRLGPAIIKERARIADAQLAIDSTPGAGARVELTFSGAEHG
jgi:signal transduction histidine kinase